MKRALAGLACALCGVCAVGCSRAPSSAGSARAERAPDRAPIVDLAQDDRVAHLLTARVKVEPFLADTSDMIPVLVSKLGAGQSDPLLAAREELAHQGSAAVPELTRFVERHFADPQGGPRLQNALTVASLMTSEAGRPLLLRALQHPASTVRLAAIRGLARHPDRNDYDRLVAQIALTGGEGQAALAEALWAADQARVEHDFFGWIELGSAPLFTESLAARLTDARDPATLDRLRELAPRVEGALRSTLETPLARAGDPAALAHLRAWLGDANIGRRELAVRAFAGAGRPEEFVGLLKSESSESLRQLVVESVATALSTPKLQSALLDATADPAPLVRRAALIALVKHGSSEAENQALELLKGDKQDLETALFVLKAGWNEREELAQRALEILERLHSGELAPLHVEQSSLARAIAQVPLQRATELLYADAKASHSELLGVDAHRWYLIQAGNTGERGWAFLRARWDEESVPAQRMDIVMACAFERSDRTRTFLAQVLDSARATPIEKLYAADLAVHLGPASSVAPLVKRVALATMDLKVRPALNNLLWSWYGLER